MPILPPALTLPHHVEKAILNSNGARSRRGSRSARREQIGIWAGKTVASFASTSDDERA